MLQYLHNGAFEDSALWLAGLFECHVYLSQILSTLKRARSTATQKPAAELTGLERSILAGVVLAYSKDRTAHLAGFLEKTCLTIMAWLENPAVDTRYNVSALLPEVLRL